MSLWLVSAGLSPVSSSFCLCVCVFCLSLPLPFVACSLMDLFFLVVQSVTPEVFASDLLYFVFSKCSAVKLFLRSFLSPESCVLGPPSACNTACPWHRRERNCSSSIVGFEALPLLVLFFACLVLKLDTMPRYVKFLAYNSLGITLLEQTYNFMSVKLSHLWRFL